MAAPSALSSVRERIVREFVLTLQGLDVGGRNLEQKVWRAWHDPTADGNMPFACVLPTTETKLTGQVGAPHNFYLCELHVDVFVALRLPQEADEDSQVVMHRALADVEKAILNRPNLIGGRGADSLVDWVHVVDNEVAFGLEQEMPFYGMFRVGFDVQYLHKDQDPDTGRA